MRLSHLSVIDIGAWNGAYAMAAKRRGAARVVACDHYTWQHPQWRGRETFDLALELSGLDIEALDLDVPDISRDTIGEFDVTLFSGVFYHLLHPVLALQKIAQSTRHALIVETHQDMLESQKPAMAFYPGSTLGNDHTNWWGPNPRLMYELLLECGFAQIFYQDSPGWDKGGHLPFRTRGIFHAFRSEESFAVTSAATRPNTWRDLGDERTRDDIFKPARRGGLLAKIFRR